MEDSKNKKILIVVHQETSTPGRIGMMLRAMGFTLDIRRPCLGDALPETMHEHAGAVVFGGPMSSNDPEPWIAREIDWIGVPLKEQKPFLGVCLGAQSWPSIWGEVLAATRRNVSRLATIPFIR